MTHQPTLFDPPEPSRLDIDGPRQAIDDLFHLAHQYRNSKDYWQLLKFIGNFRFYSPFNAMLVHIQMPGAAYVAPAHRWLRDYGRHIKPEARPLVILQPMGPVMFVFDVSDTEPEKDAPPLPQDVVAPFEVRSGYIGAEYDRTADNAKRDGIRVTKRQAGSQSAGAIQFAPVGKHLAILVSQKPTPKYAEVPHRYDILLNAQHGLETQYATLVHELAHLYCGHLGTPNDQWWPDRQNLALDLKEFEAESVCYLVCARLGIDNPSEKYLADYVAAYPAAPPISLDCVMKAAGLIEQMGKTRLPPRKEKRRE